MAIDKRYRTMKLQEIYDLVTMSINVAAGCKVYELPAGTWNQIKIIVESKNVDIIKSVDNGSKTIGQAHREITGAKKKTFILRFDKHFTTKQMDIIDSASTNVKHVARWGMNDIAMYLDNYNRPNYKITTRTKAILYNQVFWHNGLRNNYIIMQGIEATVTLENQAREMAGLEPYGVLDKAFKEKIMNSIKDCFETCRKKDEKNGINK